MPIDIVTLARDAPSLEILQDNLLFLIAQEQQFLQTPVQLTSSYQTLFRFSPKVPIRILLGLVATSAFTLRLVPNNIGAYMGTYSLAVNTYSEVQSYAWADIINGNTGYVLGDIKIAGVGRDTTLDIQVASNTGAILRAGSYAKIL